jgi:hypothetical protein
LGGLKYRRRSEERGRKRQDKQMIGRGRTAWNSDVRNEEEMGTEMEERGELIINLTLMDRNSDVRK